MEPCECAHCVGPGYGPTRCEDCFCCTSCGGPDSDCPTDAIGDSTCPCTCP